LTPPYNQPTNSNPSTVGTYQILYMDLENINLSTQSYQYGMPHEALPNDPSNPPLAINRPLYILKPSIDLPLKVPNVPLCQSSPNPHVRATHNYSIVDNQASCPTTMSSLEVPYTYPSQWNPLLSTLGIVDLVSP